MPLLMRWMGVLLRIIVRRIDRKRRSLLYMRWAVAVCCRRPAKDGFEGLGTLVIAMVPPNIVYTVSRGTGSHCCSSSIHGSNAALGMLLVFFFPIVSGEL